MKLCKVGRTLLVAILGPCYSTKFVFEEEYHEDDYFFYNDNDIDEYEFL